MQNAYFTDSWITNIIVVTSPWSYSCIIHNLIYSRWHPGWLPTSFTNLLERHPTCWHVWWICNRPDALHNRAHLYKHAYLIKWTQHACLIVLHCTNRLSESGTRSADMSDIMAPLYRQHQTCYHPSSICTRLEKCWLQWQLTSRHGL